MAFNLALSCHPVPGDRIVGLRRADEAILVHSIDCTELANGIDADWIDDQRRLDRSSVPALYRSIVGPVQTDKYSHRSVSMAPELGRGSFEVFWFDCWEVAS